MKRHHEDNPYSSSDIGGGHLPKRLATRTTAPASNSLYINPLAGNYSPPSSTESDSSSSSHSTCTSTSIHSQLCSCPNEDCVIHDRRRSTPLPVELTSTSNPTYGNKNLLLYYAHLERCRRHGAHVHQQ